MSRYVAGIRMPVGGRIVQRGDPVPEAATWRNLSAWIDQGKILVVEDLPPSSPSAENPPSGGGGLRAALLDSASHTRKSILELAEAEGVELPEKLPRGKAATVEALAGIIGLTL